LRDFPADNLTEQTAVAGISPDSFLHDNARWQIKLSFTDGNGNFWNIHHTHLTQVPANFPEDKRISARQTLSNRWQYTFCHRSLSLNTEKTLARNDNINGVCRLQKISISRITGKARDYIERL
jgi:hypothetical protein